MRKQSSTFFSHSPPLPLSLSFGLVAGLLAIALCATATAADRPIVREIFVPFADLDAILENQPQRVLLSREEYEELLKTAEKTPERHAPRTALLTSADYVGTLEEQRARFTGTLQIEVLEDGLHALPLDFSGVGLRRASLDGKPAPIAAVDCPPGQQQPQGASLSLLVEGKGRHELVIEAVAPLETTAARQVLNFRLPQPPAAKFRLTVPGDVEVKSGASVVSRTVDAQANVTRFEFLPTPGDTALVMTLNSHLQRKQRAVVARSVLVEEITQAYQRLHATFSMSILHQAVDRFRFALPDGFEVTEVSTPQLSRWAIETEGQRRILDVRLREPQTEAVVLNLSATKTSKPGEDWTMPRIEPLDVVGQMAVVGLLVEDRLGAEAIQPSGLIPIDISALTNAIPPTVLKAEPGAPTLRPVVAYYAPQAEFKLTGRFPRPAAELNVNTNVLLTLADQGQEVRGVLLLMPGVEKLFRFEFTAPAGWHVTSVQGPDGNPLAFERIGPVAADGKILVRLPQGIPPGKDFQVSFAAKASPAGWLAEWNATQVEFPKFAVLGATRDVGAIAVATRDDLVARSETVEGLALLDEPEKARYGLGGVPTSLAWRYETQDYKASLRIQRTEPRINARTFSFLQVQPDSLAAHYEIIYQIDEARARQFQLVLPEDTPKALSIRGLDDVRVKEFLPEPVEKGRRWNVLLAEPRRDRVRLAIDFQQPLDPVKAKTLALPIVRADGVAYQSGLVSVEGNAELDVQVKPDKLARRVDIGELVEAAYQPGRRLLGAYGFVGDPPPIEVEVARHPGYGLYPAIVQKAELHTLLSADGVSQTAATFALRTKAVYLEIVLPADSELWSVLVDEKPAKPQRDGDKVLVNLPSAAPGAIRSLKIVYQTPVRAVTIAGRVDLPAPRLLFRGEDETAAVEVPLADVAWHVIAPPGYQVVRSRGTVTTTIERPEPAALTFLKAVGAVLFVHVQPMQAARESARVKTAAGPAAAKSEAPAGYYMEDNVQYAPSQERYVFEGRESTEKKDMADELRYDRARKAASDERKAITRDLDREHYRVAEEAKRSEDKPMPAAEAASQPATRPAMPPPAPTTPPTATPEPQSPKPQAAMPGKDARYGQAARQKLQGFRSLKIDLTRADEIADRAVTFQSLGGDPRLDVTLANGPRLHMLGAALALIVVLAALWLGSRSAWTKTLFVLAIVVTGTLVPLVPGLGELTTPMNYAVFAACAVAVFYLAFGAVLWFVRRAMRLPWRRVRKPAAAAAIVMIALGVASSASAQQIGPTKAGNVVIVTEPIEPVSVPEDAILLPYDPDSKTGIQDAAKMLVPYAKYVELWNRAHPDKKLQEKPPVVPFALAGGSYTATLEGNEYVLLTGQLAIDSYTNETVLVPLNLAGGVLAKADLDGQAARLKLVQPTPMPQAPNAPAQPVAQMQQAANAPAQPPMPGQLVAVQVTGKGRHDLQLAVRLKLERRGGWRVVEGVLPSAPATALALTVPQAETELRLSHVPDRRSYDIEKAGEKIETALGPGGAIRVEWRPRVGEGQVDRSLTVRSSPVFDVQEDGLRLVWPLALQFGRNQRESFTLHVPGDYLVEKVEGTNVRGWEIRKEAQRQVVEVSLLKAARDGESFTVRLWRAGSVGSGDLAQFDVPMVRVADAALESGEVLVRRSPLLDVRTVNRSGASRTDLPSGKQQAAGVEDSPLGIRPYEAYQFATMPFTIRLSAAPIERRTTADVQTIYRLEGDQRSLESRIALDIRDRPIHRVAILLPEGLRLEPVIGDFHAAETKQGNRPLLTLYLAAGRQGPFAVTLRGRFDERLPNDRIPLPQIEVLDVDRRDGTIAVLADPGVNVRLGESSGVESVETALAPNWLQLGRNVLKLVLRTRATDYRGLLRVEPRAPHISCTTVTNVRVTDRNIQETVLLDFHIAEAGVRQIEFLLPWWMEKSRIQTPSLRQPTVQSTGIQPGSPVRVRLELQEEVMNDLRVLVLNDRLLSGDVQEAPIPQISMPLKGSLRQFLALESAGRDEVVVEKLESVQKITRDSEAWKELQQRLPGNITEAYLVDAGAQRPRMTYRTERREMVETAGARIGLAETTLVVDPHGTYRAVQVYKMNNATEQFLEIDLPEGASLWTAWVAGEPVKPVQVPGGSDRQVRVPLVKTAVGDLDYEVRLKYGGELPPPGALGKMQFPLMHTRNIKVSRSHVRLHVPETHEWFRFDGTLGQPRSKEDLEADRMAYQGETTQRLIDTASKANSFAKLRAANNLKQLAVVLDQSQSAAASSSNEAVQSQLRKNADVLQQAQQEIEGIQKELQPQTATEDNREQLNRFFLQQRNERARNVVGNLGYNWSDAVEGEKAAPAQAGSQLNPEWLSKNKLENAPDGKAAPAPGMKPGEQGASPSSSISSRITKGTAAGVQVQQQKFRSSGISQFEGKGDAGKMPGQPQSGEQQKAAEPADQQRLLRQYQERLEERSGTQQMQMQQQVQQAPAFDSLNMPQQGNESSFQQGQGQQGDQQGQGFGHGYGGGGRGGFANQQSGGLPQRAPGPAGAPQADFSVPVPAVHSPEANGVLGGVAIDGTAGINVTAGEGLPVAAGWAAGLASQDVEIPQRGRQYRFMTPSGDVELTARAVSSDAIERLIQAAIVVLAALVVLFAVRGLLRCGLPWFGSRLIAVLLLLVGLVALLVGFVVLGLLLLIAALATFLHRATAPAAA